MEIAKEYEAAGASAISCLTEPFYFQGSDRYLEEITAAVNIPVLRKDFTVDEYMIYQAKAFGASAVLLICAILDDVQLRKYRQLAESLGLDVLVEAHDEREVERALEAGAKIVGVNNRDLRTFRVDMNNSIRLRNLAPEEVVFVSESGIRTSADINLLYDNRVDAVLIGETLIELNGISGSITIDSELMEAYKGSESQNGKMSGDFPRLEPGVNGVSWTGGITGVTIKKNTRYL